jgi:hypothetical protein
MIFEELDPREGGVVFRAVAALKNRKENLHIVDPWSLAELRAEPEDYNWALEWACALSPNEFEARMSPWSRVQIADQPCSSRSAFGLLLFFLEAEHARRFSSEEAVWPSLLNVNWQRDVKTRLFSTQGQPTSLHRELLQEAAEKFRLRNVFGEDATHAWRISINLQFGFTARGASQQLGNWLRGCNRPEAVKLLLGAHTQTFTTLWTALKDWRRGSLSRESASNLCTWITSDAVPELLEAAQRGYIPGEEDEEDARESSLITVVAFQRDANGTLRTVLHLGEHPVGDSNASVLALVVGENVLGRWVRDEEAVGGYCWSGTNPVILPNLMMSGRASVIDPVRQETLREELFSIIDEDAVLAVFSWDGNALRNFHVAHGTGFVICVPSYLAPAGNWTEEHQIDPNWRIFEVAPHQAGAFQILDPEDGQVVWTPAAREPFLAGAGFQDNLWVRVENLPVHGLINGITAATLRWGGLPAQATLQSLRINTRPVQIPGNNNRVAIQLETADFLQNLSVRMKIRTNHGDCRIVTRQHVWTGLSQTLWNSAQGVLAFDPERTATCGALRRPEYRFLLPDANPCVFLEGSRKVRSPIPAGIGAVRDLHGYGSPLRVYRTGFNNDAFRPVLEVSRKIVDMGIFSRVIISPESVQLSFHFPRNPGPNERIVIRTSGSGFVVFGPQEVEVVNNQWVFNKLQEWGSILGVGLLYEDQPVGMWHSESWANGLGTIDTTHEAAFLRIFKAPILDRSHQIADWITQNMAAILPIWLTEGPLPFGEGLTPHASLSDHWMSALQEFLEPFELNIDQHQSRSLCECLWGGAIPWDDLNQSPAVVAAVSRRLADLSPRMGVSLLRQTFEGYPAFQHCAIHFFNEFQVDDEQLERAFRETFGEHADANFIRNVATQVVQNGFIHNLNPTQYFNAALAMRNRVFRRLITNQLLQNR